MVSLCTVFVDIIFLLFANRTVVLEWSELDGRPRPLKVAWLHRTGITVQVYLSVYLYVCNRLYMLACIIQHSDRTTLSSSFKTFYQTMQHFIRYIFFSLFLSVPVKKLFYLNTVFTRI